MSEEEKKAIERLSYDEEDYVCIDDIRIVLYLIEKQDKIIDKAINEIEILRQDFDESLQCDFIRILEILKDKKVIDW